MIRTQNEQFLELFSRTLNFFVPLICENIIAYCFDLRGLVFFFDRTHKVIFALDARTLLLHNYDKLSHIFSFILLIRNHMIFLVQFEVNKHLLISF